MTIYQPTLGRYGTAGDLRVGRKILIARIIYFLSAILQAIFCVSNSHGAAAETRPNILFILLDDMRWDDISCMGHPFSKTPNMDRIAGEGAKFLNAFATTPLCSPSRASFLTGVYPHTHGITDNTDRSAQSHKLQTFPRLLHDAGYETGFVGKWHMGNDNTSRPGWDYWACLKGQGSSYDPELNINGKDTKEKGYVTDVLHQHAMDFLKQPRTKPFLLYFAHKAIHPETEQRADGSLTDPTASNFIPAARHTNLYAGASIPRRANYLVPPTDKPALQQNISGMPPLGPQTGQSDSSIMGRLRMIAAVDESLGAMLKELERSGELDRTLVVITSDHGYFYGEHGLTVERRLSYEEGIRIPLLMRLPPSIKKGIAPKEMVLSIDLAPTILQLANVPIPSEYRGHSLTPLLRGEHPAWRNSFLVEYFSDKVFPRIRQMGYQTVRTADWKLIHYVDLNGMDELYNLRNDPFELKNVCGEPSARDALSKMQAELENLRVQTKAPAR